MMIDPDPHDDDEAERIYKDLGPKYFEQALDILLGQDIGGMQVEDHDSQRDRYDCIGECL